jgi:serine/threonine protein phosphatase PrpC
MPFNFTIACYTHQGKVRHHNEDALFVGSPIPDLSMTEPCFFEIIARRDLTLAVVDGIGGANAGEVASRLVVEGLIGLERPQPTAVEERLKELNQRVYSLAQDDEKLSGMGAALAGIAFAWEPEQEQAQALIFHVGDCRVYRIKDGFFQQMTEDDTTAQVLVRAGKLDPDAIRGEKQHGLLQALGGHRSFTEINPHVRSLPLHQAERFMVCSDGITDFLSVDDLEDLVRPEWTVEDCAQRLIAASAQTDQKDNVSFILSDVAPFLET